MRTEDKLGELLEATDQATGGFGPGRGEKGVEAHDTLLVTPTLAEMGITRDESANAQAFHKLPPEVKEAVIKDKITRTEAKRQAKREAAHKKVGKPEKLTGKYRVVYADPP